MRLRLIPLLLIAAAFIFACGPRSHSSEVPVRKPATGSGVVASSLDVTLDERVSFALHVTNNNDRKLELTFPSGLTHDLVVLDEGGHEVWRWSDGRMFTQTLQNKVLDAHETVSYQVAWTPPTARHGTFVAVASLRSENHPLEQRVRFTLP